MTRDAPRIAIVLGTRPEIIKFAPIVQACEDRELPVTVIHTGQHYSDPLDTVFFDQLGLPSPDRNLAVGSGSHGEQTGSMLAAIEAVLLEEDVDVVLVQGDTNSTLAGAIAAAKLDVSLGHVEAGLRSFDRSMPEELNRIVADHVADHLFAPTAHAEQTLHEEGVPPERTTVTGNTVVDAIEHTREIAERESDVLDELALGPDEYVLVTAHRPANVDDPERFADLLAGVDRVATTLDLPALYPMHPRAADRLQAAGLELPDSVCRLDPQGYFDFLSLERHARLVLTDSGGVQEEACVLGVPCVTLRDSTERPETLTVGANRLAGPHPGDVVDAALAMAELDGEWDNPFGDGDAADRILDVVAGRARPEVVG